MLSSGSGVGGDCGGDRRCSSCGRMRRAEEAGEAASRHGTDLKIVDLVVRDRRVATDRANALELVFSEPVENFEGGDAHQAWNENDERTPTFVPAKIDAFGSARGELGLEIRRG